MKDRTKKGLLDLLLLLAGTLLLAFAVKCIYEPLDMVTGGFSGLAILIKAVTEHMVPGGIPLGVSSLLLNIPVFLWAFWKKGKTFAGKSFAAMILLSLWLSILPAWNLAGDDMVIGCAFGGGIMGFGIGLVLRTRSTTGGTDMLAALLHMKFQQYSIVRIMQVIDAVIVLAGLSLFGLKSGLYAIIAIVITTKSVGSNSRRIQNVQSSVYFVREERGDCTGYYDGTGPWYDRSACKRHVYPAGKMYAPVCGIKKRDCLAEGNRHENRPKSIPYYL